MILADKIVTLRKRAGWSQEELAAQLGVSRQSVSKWEGAQSVPDMQKVVQMSRLFGVTTDYLLKEELGEPEPAPAESDAPLRRVTMEQAADYLVGEHDFKSFCSARSQVENTVRTIYFLQVIKEGDQIRIRINGNGFLYNMVRIIVGTLLKVGTGMYPPEHMKEILEAKDRRMAGPKAEARGLTLMEIEYL